MNHVPIEAIFRHLRVHNLPEGLNEHVIMILLLLQSFNRVQEQNLKVSVKKTDNLFVKLLVISPSRGLKIEPLAFIASSDIRKPIWILHIEHFGKIGMSTATPSNLNQFVGEVVAARFDHCQIGLAFFVSLEDVGLPLEILLLRRHVLERKGADQSRSGLDVLPESLEIHFDFVALTDGDPVVNEGGCRNAGIMPVVPRLPMLPHMRWI